MKEENENIENGLGNLKKDNPFRVPEGYFETFADRLKVRIEEDEQSDKKKSLFFYLKPVLMMAASFAFVMLLVYVPVKKLFPPAGEVVVAQQKLKIDSSNADSIVPATLISYFSEGQLLSAVSDMIESESDTLSTDNLGDFIADSYNDYEILAAN